MVIDRLITSELVIVDNIDRKEEERILKFFEKRYDIEYLEEDILLKKKSLN
jgi:hypothetical protein